MAHDIPQRNSNRRRTCCGIGVALLMSGSMSGAAYADESGVSYWLPGRFGSLAATPQVPGWSMAAVYYHTSVEASGAVAAARQIQIGRFPATVNVNLNASLNAQADLILLNPTYTFATPVLGGQLAIGVTGLFGRASTGIDGTLTTVTRTDRDDPHGKHLGFAHFRRRPVSAGHAEVERRRAQLHDLSDRRHSGRRLRSRPPHQSRHRSRRDRRRRRLHLFQSGGRARILRRRGLHLQFQESRTRNTRTESTSTSIGESRNSSPSRFSLASSAMDINRSPTISVRIRCSADSGPASSASARRSDFFFPVGDMQGYLNLKGYGEFAAENRPSGGMSG